MTGWARVLIHIQFVADTPDRHNQRWLCWVRLDLGAKPVDVGIDRVFVAVMPIAPNAVQQPGAGKYMPWVASKMQQQIELPGRK